MATAAVPNSSLNKFDSTLSLFSLVYSYHSSNLDSNQQMYGVPVKFADDLFSTVCSYLIKIKT
jgi:hypothetical protein